MNIREVFETTITIEQEIQVFHLQIISFLGIGFIWVLFYLQKSIETRLWRAAQSNYEIVENISKEMLQAVEAKDTFVSSLSHEIRNPLNAIKGSIDYLLRVVKDPAHLKVLGNAKLSGEVLLNLVNNVLDAAKLKAEKMEISYIETNSIDILRKVLLIHSERLEEKNIFAQAFIDRTLPLILWTDPSRLLQILMNLFSNALKFTPEKGKIRLSIFWCNNEQTREELLAPDQEFLFQDYLDDMLETGALPSLQSVSDRSEENKLKKSDTPMLDEFSFETAKTHLTNLKAMQSLKPKILNDLNTSQSKTASRYSVWNINKMTSEDIKQAISNDPSVVRSGEDIKEKGFLKVQITDTGCGISQTSISSLFEMFAQGDRNIASVHGGSGLGLWICKQLCQKMGGDIAVYSKPDLGTTFVFYIPVKNDLLSEVHYTERTPINKKVRALVVDDQPYNRDLHKLILEREGVQVSLACDGKQACEKYMKQEEGYFDFIMMDVQMPEMDGFSAARNMREWENENKRRFIDIYFVSGEYYNEEEVMVGLSQSKRKNYKNSIRCLRKPIDVETIKKIVIKYTSAPIVK